MKGIKSSFIIILSVVLLFSCSKGEKRIEQKYSDGSPKLVSYYKDGKKTYEERYYSNSNKRSEGAFADSVRTGAWKFYFDSGKLFAKADFSNKKEGEAWEVYKEDGEVLASKKEALSLLSFSPEGTLVELSVKVKGEPNKEIYYRFFDSFHLMLREYMIGGLLQGQAISWYESGKVNSECYYKDGYEDSLYVLYSESGQKQTIGRYDKGLKVGKWEYFSPKGEPLGFEVYSSEGDLLEESNTQGLRFSHSGKRN